MTFAGKRSQGLTVIGIILIIILAGIMIAAIVINFLFHNKDSVVSAFGRCYYITDEEYMFPHIPENSMVIGSMSEIMDVKVGSIALCSIDGKYVLTHVDKIHLEEGQRIYTAVSYTDSGEDTLSISADKITARIGGYIEGFGSFINFITSVYGIIFMIIIPFIVIIVTSAAILF